MWTKGNFWMSSFKTMTSKLIFFLVAGMTSALSSCCSDPYSMKWMAIMADNATNGVITRADTIKSAEFSIRVEMLTRKEHQTTWKIIPEAQAVDCFPRYDFLDTISAIKLKRLNEDSSIVDVTQQFSGNIYYSGNTQEPGYPLEMLSRYMNSSLYGNGDQVSIYPANGQTFTGKLRFILEFSLSDQRVLRDTTKLVDLVP